MKCQHCHKRKATINYVSKGCFLDFAHAFYQRLCKKCVIRAQLKHAKKVAQNIPKLEKELRKLNEN